MARKRRRDIEECSDSDDDVLVQSIDGSISASEDDNIFCSQDGLATGGIGAEDSSSNGDSEFNFNLYHDALKDYKKVKEYKNKLKRRFLQQSAKAKTMMKSKDAFTRFSVKAFSDVLDALTPHHKNVIEEYGFGSLLLFEKCFVPNRFAKWVAQLVDYNSGDIIVGGKIISLTKESVHHVLGIPLGGRPFPNDTSAGKSVVLEKFNRTSIPPVKFFANKLINHEPLSDVDIFICFIVVALHSFLCPNASIVPSYRYFGIFDDIENVRDFDWCGFVLSWLIEHIKQYKKKKAKSINNSEGSLGGCIYYLAVLYLDFVDFGPRRVSNAIPRISVWKGNMIRTYSNYDLKSPGQFGFRPIMDIGDTCYCKNIDVIRTNAPPIQFDAAFMEELDSVSRCNIPFELKQSICQAIERHCFSSALIVNLDLASISHLPENIFKTFTKLLQHASSVDQRSKKLVLDVLKLITEYPHDSDHNTPTVASPNHTPVNTPKSSSPLLSTDNIPTPVPCCQSGHQSSEHIDLTKDSPKILQSAMKNNAPAASKSCAQVPDSPLVGSLNHAMQPSSSTTPAGKVNEDMVKNKLQRNSSVTPIQSNKRHGSGVQSGAYSKDHAKLPKHQARLKGSRNFVTESEIASLRAPLCDISNVGVVLTKSKIMQRVSTSDSDEPRDVIPLDDDKTFVPDSLSPVTRSKPRMSSPVKLTSDSEDESSFLTQRENVPKFTPNLPKKHSVLSSTRNVSFTNLPASDKSARSKDVQVIGQRTLSQSVRDMTKTSDDIYNKQFHFSSSTPRTSPEYAFPEMYASGSSSKYPPYVSRDSFTGGKVPIHGPRRPVKSTSIFHGDYETATAKFNVSRSELKYYKNICSLATSQYSNDNAVCLGKVRCTFWSLGDSLKPSGSVNPFVMSAYCYSLYIKPTGHPDVSKSHYFFANIGENLLKDDDEANHEVLACAFKRSSKSRPLNHCNNLYFPTCYNNHWFVFVVNIKDNNFVFLDPLHHKDHEFLEYVTEKMVNHFQLHWDKYVRTDMKFDDYNYLYPDMPEQALDSSFDSGIFAMMSLSHWNSPRSVLRYKFDSSDIPTIRVKIANELVFQPTNEGNKTRVIEYEDSIHIDEPQKPSKRS
ncbi:unnamed protein product [Urochloa decumbens]|uniref:Ubiquitin-like protease family profile domain-containing protein n=1 Tax=Urochloa decumbens TaxID=240449 RepID=A0ABC9ACE5_9POAL